MQQRACAIMTAFEWGQASGGRGETGARHGREGHAVAVGPQPKRHGCEEKGTMPCTHTHIHAHEHTDTDRTQHRQGEPTALPVVNPVLKLGFSRLRFSCRSTTSPSPPPPLRRYGPLTLALCACAAPPAAPWGLPGLCRLNAAESNFCCDHRLCVTAWLSLWAPRSCNSYLISSV